jgi:hypothetical protein
MNNQIEGRYVVKANGRTHSRHRGEIAAESAAQRLAGSKWDGEYVPSAQVYVDGRCTYCYYDSQHRSD